MVSLKFLNPLTSNRLSIIKSPADSIIPKTAEIVNSRRKKITDIQKGNYGTLCVSILVRLSLLLRNAISCTHVFFAPKMDCSDRLFGMEEQNLPIPLFF